MKTISLRIQDELYEEIKKKAKLDNRSVNSYIAQAMNSLAGIRLRTAPHMDERDVVTVPSPVKVQTVPHPHVPAALKTSGNMFERSGSFCREGHQIPAGRDKCLGKGCKYA